MKKLLCLVVTAMLALPLFSTPTHAQRGTGLIGGWVFLDWDENGVKAPDELGQPATVCLVDQDECLHTATGQFEFNGLAPGTYKVKLILFPDGLERTTPKKYSITLEDGEQRTDVMFGLIEPPGYRASMIRGWAFHDLNANGVRDEGEQGLPETVICLIGYDWCDHTEWGEYMFDMLNPGTYKVKLVDFPDGYELTTPQKYVITLKPYENRTDVHFGLAEIPGYRASLIRGWAFLDSNENGQRDVGEEGLAETVICLIGYDWCDHTEWGEFEFDMLNPGTYKVKLVSYPDGYALTTPKKYIITLQPDEVRTDVHFGLAPLP